MPKVVKGEKTGLSIGNFYAQVFFLNEVRAEEFAEGNKKKKPWTDDQIREKVQAEFPEYADQDKCRLINTMRGCYNKGYGTLATAKLPEDAGEYGYNTEDNLQTQESLEVYSEGSQLPRPFSHRYNSKGEVEDKARVAPESGDEEEEVVEEEESPKASKKKKTKKKGGAKKKAVTKKKSAPKKKPLGGKKKATKKKAKK